MSHLPVGLLLAAGQGKRFGSNKLLHPIEDELPMFQLMAEKMLDVLPEVVLVINPQLIPYVDSLEQRGMHVVLNEQAEQGIGSSIACGVRASPDATGWLIALADMPYVKTQTIQQLSQRLQKGADIVAPLYKQQRGHPVGFKQCFKDELMNLDSDIGAREIIQNHQDQLELLESDDAGTITDIDQMSDLSIKIE
ncbi:MAG: nucleotidyltransferase family protein [Gammaproteobacteria bacterium]|nr:nucleotidyltransferase family protein [Gammaproteobacteria bacterium]